MTVTREYICPECGYTGFKMGAPKVTGGIDINVQAGCPACKTVRDKNVWLVETTDPRSAA